jgi:hypothetical protein
MRPISDFARRAAAGAIATGSRPRSRAACATARVRRAMPSSSDMRTNASCMFSPVVMAPWFGRMTTGLSRSASATGITRSSSAAMPS